uniref:Uncharacterized protein n=1 Tax=Anguilla anguilla TaxID=7936 RepID=A0A0E9UQ05_ANGAN
MHSPHQVLRTCPMKIVRHDEVDLLPEQKTLSVVDTIGEAPLESSRLAVGTRGHANISQAPKPLRDNANRGPGLLFLESGVYLKGRR